MSTLKIEDVRFSSSSIDDFFSPSPIQKVANGKIRVANLHQISGFQLISSDKLVHLSQKDFWKLGQDADGFFIERLVDDADGPVTG